MPVFRCAWSGPWMWPCVSTPCRDIWHASPTHRDICVCRPCAWELVCERLWLCTFLWLCSCLQSVAGERPWPLCGHMSLCWVVSTKAANPGLPSRARGPFSPKEKGRVLRHHSLSCSCISAHRINTATTLREANVEHQLAFTLSPWTLLLMAEQNQYLQHWSIAVADKPGLNLKQPETGPLGLLSPAKQRHEGSCTERRRSPHSTP